MLIPNWKVAYKMWSVLAAALLAAFDALVAILPTLHDYFNQSTLATINVVCVIAVAFLRVVQQHIPVDEETKQQMLDSVSQLPTTAPAPLSKD